MQIGNSADKAARRWRRPHRFVAMSGSTGFSNVFHPQILTYISYQYISKCFVYLRLYFHSKWTHYHLLHGQVCFQSGQLKVCRIFFHFIPPIREIQDLLRFYICYYSLLLV